jgi:CHAT domain-containing protein
MKPEHLALLDELRVVAQQLSNLTHQGTGHLQLEVFRRRREELSLRQEQLETKLESELAKWGAEFREEQIAPVSLVAVQTAVPKDAVLVEWSRYQPFDPKTKDRLSRWGPPRYVAYVLKHDSEATVVDVGEADTIEQLIRDLQKGLNSPATTFVKDVAKELSDKLLQPLLPFLRDTERLLISPDGALDLIPFGALLDETGAYLATTRDITYLTSGRALLLMSAPSVAKNDAVVVADPDFGPSTSLFAEVDPSGQQMRSVDLDRRRVQFTRLEGTAKEAVALTGLLNIKDGHLLLQAQATEAALKQLQGPRILHVATHGFFLNDNELPAVALKAVNFSQDQVAAPMGENPLLRSGLALAGANLRHSGEKDDGILTAAEVAQMDLRGTQLVVLSACETGVGEVQNGEGVYGLRRALVLAGAETQVTSLWKVADEATKDLMVDYYQRLLKGEGRSEALRNAQLAMMKSKDRSHPYYWAAFVLIGDWRPLAKSH